MRIDTGAMYSAITRVSKRATVVPFLTVILTLMMTATLASAQIHGIPAGATSLGPNGYSQPIDASRDFGRDDGRAGDGYRNMRLHQRYYPVPVAMPYYIYGYQDSDALDQIAARLNQLERTAEKKNETVQTAAQPTPIVVEVKLPEQHLVPAAGAQGGQSATSGAAATLMVPAANHTGSAPVAAPVPVEDFAPVVLVFRDGHRIEIKDYALVAGAVVDVSSAAMPRYAVADLDLAATKDENQRRGISFAP